MIENIKLQSSWNTRLVVNKAICFAGLWQRYMQMGAEKSLIKSSSGRYEIIIYLSTGCQKKFLFIPSPKKAFFTIISRYVPVYPLSHDFSPSKGHRCFFDFFKCL